MEFGVCLLISWPTIHITTNGWQIYDKEKRCSFLAQIRPRISYDHIKLVCSSLLIYSLYFILFVRFHIIFICWVLTSLQKQQFPFLSSESFSSYLFQTWLQTWRLVQIFQELCTKFVSMMLNFKTWCIQLKINFWSFNAWFMTQ